MVEKPLLARLSTGDGLECVTVVTIQTIPVILDMAGVAYVYVKSGKIIFLHFFNGVTLMGGLKIYPWIVLIMMAHIVLKIADGLQISFKVTINAIIITWIGTERLNLYQIGVGR